MRWALLLLVLAVVVALVAAGGPKEGKGHKTKKELQAKHAEFKESHGKKCHGKKCGSTEKYTKGKNKKAMEEPVDASEAVEAASGRTKREAEQTVPVDAKPRKGKKVPSETKTKGKKAKKSKKGAEKIDPESAVVEEEAVPSEAQDAKVSKKTKRSADDAGLADVPLSEKASKHKKKKATEAELNKKVKPKKAKKEPTAEEPKDIAVEDTEVAVEDAAGDANGPAGVKTEPETACASEQCANEE